MGPPSLTFFRRFENYFTSIPNGFPYPDSFKLRYLKVMKKTISTEVRQVGTTSRGIYSMTPSLRSFLSI